MIDIGYIKLHRHLNSDPIWTAEPFSRGQAWVDLILLANHKPGHIRKDGHRIEVDRGELGWSEVSLADRWKWSRGKVRRFLSELSSKIEQKIEQRKSNVTTIIRILNYEKYQGNGTADGTPDDTADGQQTDTNNNEKKDICKTNTRAMDDLPKWKSSFETYLSECEASARTLLDDHAWVSEQQQLNPNVDIRLTMKKAYANYWSTEEAWKRLKAKRTKTINWRSTWQNALSNRINRVYLEKGPTPAAREPTAAEKNRAERRAQVEFLAKMRERENEIQSRSEGQGSDDIEGVGGYKRLCSGE